MSRFDALKNLGGKVTRRVLTAHKPLVRMARRGARSREHQAVKDDAARIEQQIARAAAGTGPIVAGPWLAEVGYETLYWIPFLRWFCDAHRVPRERLVVLTRGGMAPAYRELAAGYVDILDLIEASELTRRAAERRSQHEGGGQKQSDLSALDRELVEGARAQLGLSSPAVLHPSSMFRLFRHAWHGTLPMDLFWRHVRYARMSIPAESAAELELVPQGAAVVKLYTGHSLTGSAENTDQLRRVVARLAARMPVVTLDTDFGLDEHRDIDLSGLPGVTSLRSAMSPRTNLNVQLAALSRAALFFSTCGGLAWLAPFLGVRTIGVFDNDQLLAPHLLVARQAGKLVGAAQFATLDLRGLVDIGLWDPTSHASTS